MTVHFDTCGLRLLGVAEEQARDWAFVFAPIILGGVLIAQRTLTKRCTKSASVDRFAEVCALEASALLEATPPNPFAAYFGLEIAAAREPQRFGPCFRAYRDRLMRTVLSVAREAGVRANVETTTTAGRWVGRLDPRVHAELVDGSLRVVLANGRSFVLDPDLGMAEGFDA